MSGDGMDFDGGEDFSSSSSAVDTIDTADPTTDVGASESFDNSSDEAPQESTDDDSEVDAATSEADDTEADDPLAAEPETVDPLSSVPATPVLTSDPGPVPPGDDPFSDLPENRVFSERHPEFTGAPAAEGGDDLGPVPPGDDPFSDLSENRAFYEQHPEFTPNSGPSTGFDGGGIPATGLDPTGMADTNPLWVDPATTSVDLSSPSIVGHPDLEGTYLQYQGEGNAFCGPYSAAMALTELTGEDWSGDGLKDWAVDAGYLTNDGDPTDDAWGGWSGMSPPDLDALLDAQLEQYGGTSELTDGNTMDDLETRLAAGEKVITFVDSGELRDAAPDADELPGTEGNPNHFLVVTGIDRGGGWVFMNDPYRQQPAMMPLAQFEGAWRDSNGAMFSLSTPAATGSANAPLVALPGLTEQPVEEPTGEQDTCCVLPVTYDLLAAAPMEIVDGTIVPETTGTGGQPGVDEWRSGAADTVAAQLGHLWVDPATTKVDLHSTTMLGHPDLDATYKLFQGVDTVTCGPYSAAMALNALTGEDTWTGEDLAAWAGGSEGSDGGEDSGEGQPVYLHEDGMLSSDLAYMIQAQGDHKAVLSEDNTLTTIGDSLKKGHKVIVNVDSSEVWDATDVDEKEADERSDHFMLVTGIDTKQGFVFFNDPANDGKTGGMMPLAQFEAAWADSGHEMIDISKDKPDWGAPVETDHHSTPSGADDENHLGSFIPVTFTLAAADDMSVVDGIAGPGTQAA